MRLIKCALTKNRNTFSQIQYIRHEKLDIYATTVTRWSTSIKNDLFSNYLDHDSYAAKHNMNPKTQQFQRQSQLSNLFETWRIKKFSRLSSESLQKIKISINTSIRSSLWLKMSMFWLCSSQRTMLGYT